MTKTKELPVLPIRDPNLVVFPGQVCEIDVGRAFSLNAIAASQENYSGRIIIVMQKNFEVSSPIKEDFYSICLEAEIKQVSLLSSNGSQKRSRIIVIGSSRATLKNIELYNDLYYLAKIEPSNEVEVEITDDLKVHLRETRSLIKKHYSASVLLKNSAIPQTSSELSAFVDDIISQLKFSHRAKIDLLRQLNPEKRLEKLYKSMAELIVQQASSAQEPEDISVKGEIEKLEDQMNVADMPEEALKIASQEIKRLKMMAPSSSEFQVILNYVEQLVSLPWHKSGEDRFDLDFAKQCLDEDHYGLEKVKERILEFLAVKKLVPNQKGSILCLAGSPGTGKTSCAKSIARAMNKEYVRMSLGGLHDEAEIRGHRKTYIGAMPGRIIQCLKKAGVNNPVFVLDEIDKLSKDYRGDPSSALLEVLDPEQNNSFQDNYINTPFDLSKVFFITTANDLSTIPLALRDRLEIIEVPGYSPFDKLKIAQNYLVPKQMEENGISNLPLTVSEKALGRIIEEYTSEAGVRRLERLCGTVMRKIAVMVATNKKPPSNISVNMVPKLLGSPKLFKEKANEEPTIGVSTGLAWSQHGGSIMFVEAMLTPGKGNIKVTGSVGKVLEESVGAAFTWIRSHAQEYGVDLEKISSHDIHVHLPAGATPKDGPSAGIAITSCLLSLILNKPVNNKVAMTGEISLTGKVLPIGGLKEKVLAAQRAGIEKVIFPKENVVDLEDIPKDVLDSLQMFPVGSLSEALPLILDLPQSDKKYCGTASVEAIN